MSRKPDEPVRLTRIYTRGGDAGETSLGDGSRVSKLDCRIGAFGAVDELNAHLPELKSFVLPGGTETAARLHVARTVCRRAEREVLLASQELELNPLVLVYLNRLSDLLFILARAANAGREEPLWKPGASR